MFEVEAVEQGFLTKRARLRAVTGAAEVTVLSSDAASWAGALRSSVAEGDVVTVNLPAYVQLEPGQTVTAEAA